MKRKNDRSIFVAVLCLTGIVLLFFLGYTIGKNYQANRSEQNRPAYGNTQNTGNKQGKELAGTSNEAASGHDKNESAVAGKPESIAGIALGVAKEEVVQVLGDDYNEEYHEEGAYYGEPYYIWQYSKGIRLIIGSNTNKVLQIIVTSPDYVTALGAKVGDTYQDVNAKYEGKYSVPESRHGDDRLEGWYELPNYDVIIFDFDLEDDSTFNFEVQPDSQVEQIILTNWNYLD
jgi:hypothetical protein